jgi:plasmid stability protein
VKNITLALDDETYRRARIRAAEENTSVSALVKQFLTEAGAGAPSKRVLEQAAELRVLIAGRTHTPAEVLQREGRESVAHGAKADLLARLQAEPVTEVGRWTRDDLYEDAQ